MVNDCELREMCGFFAVQMADLPTAAEAVQGRYCRGDRNSCARYLAWKETGKMPPELLPSELEYLRLR